MGLQLRWRQLSLWAAVLAGESFRIWSTRWPYSTTYHGAYAVKELKIFGMIVFPALRGISTDSLPKTFKVRICHKNIAKDNETAPRYWPLWELPLRWHILTYMFFGFLWCGTLYKNRALAICDFFGHLSEEKEGQPKACSGGWLCYVLWACDNLEVLKLRYICIYRHP